MAEEVNPAAKFMQIGGTGKSAPKRGEAGEGVKTKSRAAGRSAAGEWARRGQGL